VGFSKVRGVEVNHNDLEDTPPGSSRSPTMWAALLASVSEDMLGLIAEPGIIVSNY
jgi:hypothetical protein